MRPRMAREGERSPHPGSPHCPRTAPPLDQRPKRRDGGVVERFPVDRGGPRMPQAIRRLLDRRAPP